MRRSFGGAGGGMGGGGGGMLRSVHRAVRAGIGGAPPEPFSHFSESGGVGSAKSRNYRNPRSNESTTSPNTNLNLSSSSSFSVGANDKSSNCSKSSNGSTEISSLISLPLSAASGAAAASQRGFPSPTYSDDSEWECVDGSEDGIGMSRVWYEDFVFGIVPSRDEVQHAVSALQQVVGQSSICFSNPNLAEDAGNDIEGEVAFPTGSENGKSSANADIDWFEPSMHLCDSRMSLTSHGSNSVYDSFHLLKTEPSVQRMVISLSSDKSVWDAVLNNDVVKELRGSIGQDGDKLDKIPADEGSDNNSNPIKDIFSWVFVNAESKIMQLINKIAKLLIGVFRPQNVEEKGGITDSLEDKVKASLCLSIIVLLIVVVTRVQSA